MAFSSYRDLHYTYICTSFHRKVYSLIVHSNFMHKKKKVRITCTRKYINMGNVGISMAVCFFVVKLNSHM